MRKAKWYNPTNDPDWDVYYRITWCYGLFLAGVFLAVILSIILKGHKS